MRFTLNNWLQRVIPEGDDESRVFHDISGWLKLPSRSIEFSLQRGERCNNIMVQRRMILTGNISKTTKKGGGGFFLFELGEILSFEYRYMSVLARS